ncbi:MAG: glycosyltransferase [Bacteroidales bacterium]|nr:glycosyltransferase [Bacteroidales bacterium]
MGIQEIYALLLLVMISIFGFIISAYTIGLIRTRKHKRLQINHPEGVTTVIIPVRNESGNIIRILEEMHGQDFPVSQLEIIVTDDHSGDDTMSQVTLFAIKHPGFPLHIVHAVQSGINTAGKKRAIERAVAVAKGDILLFTDADTIRGPGWISSMVYCFGTPGVEMVLGPVYFFREKNLLQRIQSLEFLGLMGATAGSAALGYPVMCNGANLAYRRDAFLQSGGFRGNLKYSSGDDQFMMSAVRKHYGKGSLVFNTDPLSMVGTEPEATFAGFFNQRLRWVSKSRGYRDPVVILVGGVTYLTHLFLLAGMCLGFFFPKLLIISFLLWLSKIVLEYPMVWIMIRFFGKKDLTSYYFIAQIFQLLYVPIVGVLGLLVPFRWKGRRGIS